MKSYDYVPRLLEEYAFDEPLMGIEVKSTISLSSTLKNRVNWFPDAPTLGIQVVDQRNVLKKYPDDLTLW